MTQATLELLFCPFLHVRADHEREQATIKRLIMVTKDRICAKDNSNFEHENQIHDERSDELKVFRSRSEKISGKLKENFKKMIFLTPFFC